jgi:hypothetical protein
MTPKTQKFSWRKLEAAIVKRAIELQRKFQRQDVAIDEQNAAGTVPVCHQPQFCWRTCSAVLSGHDLFGLVAISLL